MGEGCPTQKGCQRSSLMSYLLLLLPIVQDPLVGRPANSPQSPYIWGVCACVHVFVSYAGKAEEPPTCSLMENRTWSRTWPPGQGQVANSSMVLSLYSFQSAFYLFSVLDLYTYTLRQAEQESLSPFHSPETGLSYWPSAWVVSFWSWGLTKVGSAREIFPSVYSLGMRNVPAFPHGERVFSLILEQQCLLYAKSPTQLLPSLHPPIFHSPFAPRLRYLGTQLFRSTPGSLSGINSCNQ